MALADKGNDTDATSATTHEREQSMPIHKEHIDVESSRSWPAVDSVSEKKLLRKLDIRIIPMLVVMYLLNFMDRVNIGNARLYGLEEDLGLRGNEFQLAVSILFVTYCLCETPSNMIIKRMKPARYLGALIFLWGIAATFTSFVQNFGQLVACRLILGVCEAGFFPGVILYLSMFYNKKSMALRNAIFYGTSALAGAIGGLVAYAIGEMDNGGEGTAGWRGWRWIICLIGIPTVLTAPIAIFVLPNSPDTAKFLSAEDRANLLWLRENEIGQTKSGQSLHKEDVMRGVKDWKTYAFAIAQFAGLCMLYSFSVFLPTIINEIGGGWSRQVVQALTVPVYSTGLAAYIICAWLSDRIQQRGIFCIGGMLTSMVGYVLLIANKGVGLSFAGCFVVAIGLWVSTGLAFTWIAVNNPRYGKRAFASGMQITIGNSSGVAAPFLFSKNYAPTFYPGYGAHIGMLALGSCIYAALHLWFRNANKRKLSGNEDWRMDGKSEEEIAELGEDNPRYMYTI